MAWLSSAPMSLGALSTARRSAGVGGRLAPPRPVHVPSGAHGAARSRRGAPTSRRGRRGLWSRALQVCSPSPCAFSAARVSAAAPRTRAAGGRASAPSRPLPPQAAEWERQAAGAAVHSHRVHGAQRPGADGELRGECARPGRVRSGRPPFQSGHGRGGEGCCAWALPGGALRGAGLGLVNRGP